MRVGAKRSTTALKFKKKKKKKKKAKTILINCIPMIFILFVLIPQGVDNHEMPRTCLLWKQNKTY